MITSAQYTDLRARYDAKQAWVKTHAWEGKKWVSYDPASLPIECQCSNKETGLIEHYEFMTDPPAIYTAYVLNSKGERQNWWNADHYVGTFVGDHMGRIVASWEANKAAFGFRTAYRALVVLGDNGILYHAMFCYTAGDYVTLRAYKHQDAAKYEYNIHS